MMRFVIGVVVGALGYWAYAQNRVPSPWSTTEPSAASQSSPIIRPTAQEVAGRPSEPIPG